MPRTFDEILARFDDCHAYDGDDVIEALNAAREAVGGDPAEWWVEDANGDHVHIDDCVTYNGKPRKIALLGTNGDVMDEETSFVKMINAFKVIPDTREKIIEDAMAKFVYDIIPVKTREVIEEAVDRAMKLGADDAE